MTRRIDPVKATETIRRGMELIGRDVRELERFCSYHDIGKANRDLNAWRKEAKADYKRAVSRHHPDKGGDPETMVLLNEFWDLLQEVTIQRKRPPRPAPSPSWWGPFQVVNIRWTNTSGASWSGTSTTTNGWG